jgi:hypothetical protein
MRAGTLELEAPASGCAAVLGVLSKAGDVSVAFSSSGRQWVL